MPLTVKAERLHALIKEARSKIEEIYEAGEDVIDFGILEDEVEQADEHLANIAREIDGKFIGPQPSEGV